MRAFNHLKNHAHITIALGLLFISQQTMAQTAMRSSSNTNTHKKSSRIKSVEEMTLDDYEREDDGIVIEPNSTKRRTLKDRPVPWAGKSSLGQFSFTSLRIGASLTAGSWPADRTNNTMLSLSVGKLLIPAPVYVAIEASATVSPATPRNFLLDGSLSGGLIHANSYSAPFAGFRVGAGRLVVSGRGQEFGAVLGPELGVFPGRIKGKPFSIRARYSWVPARVNGIKPQWYGIDFGFHI
jgi:hypothetical protein